MWNRRFFNRSVVILLFVLASVTCVVGKVQAHSEVQEEHPSASPSSPPSSSAPVPPLEPELPQALVGGTATVHPPASPAPLAVTISGGGTLGAYMGGQLYYMGLSSRLSNAYEPRVFTGASAGSINAFISVLTSCGQLEEDPSQSLFWKVWIPAGLDRFFLPEQEGGTSILSPKGFSDGIESLQEAWKRGMPKDCDLLFGAAITRAKPLDVHLAPGFPAIPRSLETVMLRVRGRGKGREPLLTNYIDPQRVTPQILLPLDGPDADFFASLEQLALASSAFPLGFPPVSLDHCLRGPEGPSQCSPAESESALFIDGGVFDNQPLGLAVRAMRGVHTVNGKLVVADSPSRAALPPDSRFYFLDPRVKGYPALPANEETLIVDDVLGVVTNMFSMIQSVRSNELIAIFDRAPEIRNRLFLGRTFYPPASGTFSGFIDRSFREFDFYLGMYDAARTVRDYQDGSSSQLAEDVFVPAPNAKDLKWQSWRRFLCLQAVLDGTGDTSLCAGKEMLDFRILLQLSLDQLTDTCQRLSTKSAKTKNRQCRQVIRGGKAARVPGVKDLADTRRGRRAGEGTLAYQFRLLAHYGFHFKDLGLTRSQASQATQQMIRLGHRMSRKLAETQPRNGLLVGVLARVGVDTELGYLPPKHILHIAFGLGAEGGYSYSVGRLPWLRLGMALGLDGFSTLLNASDNYLAIIPKAGLEVEVLGNAMVQLRLGVRGGYQFSTADALASGTCDFSREKEAPCSRLVTEGYLSATALGILRLQVAAGYAPALKQGQKRLYALSPILGLQINSPF